MNETALKSVFHWPRERLAAQHVAVRESLGESDTSRLKCRTELSDTFASIVRAKTGRQKVAEEISRLSAGFGKPGDRAAFAAIVADERLGLHEGNFARSEVFPPKLRAWQEVRASS